MSRLQAVLPPIVELPLAHHTYRLRPGVAEQAAIHFEQQQHYAALNQVSQTLFKRQAATAALPLLQAHKSTVRGLLPKPLCQMLIDEYERDPVGIQSPQVLNVLLPHVFTPELDQQLISYFQSEYCIFWWSIYKVENHMEHDGYFTRWHADSGPEKHLKVIIYLNSYHEHGSDTAFLDVTTSDALKQVGYLFNDLDDRVSNLSELCDHLQLAYEPSFLHADTGDCLVFNPHQLAHKAIVPQNHMTRYALNFSLVPAPFHWTTMLEDYWQAQYDCQSFSGFALELLRRFGMHDDATAPLNAVIEIADLHRIDNAAHIRWLCQHIFQDSAMSTALSEQILGNDPSLSQCDSIFNFLRICRNLLLGPLQQAASLDLSLVTALQQLAHYEQQFQQSIGRYNLRQGQSASSLFWPDPTDPRHPKSKYDLLPYVNKQPILDRTTPIGSAGSCFAVEIAKVLQQRGFNYVVTESNDDPAHGVMLDTAVDEPTLARFSAAYGLLFNSPSFCQLAERAFGERDFSKLVVDANGQYVDPYREGVRFASVDAYLANYDAHVAAVREALLACEVFVVTLGLNECWQLLDGTFISRNPRANMYHMAKHRFLTVEQNVHYIQRFFDLVKARNPAFKLIISVSPVPLMATGRHQEQHIISANCHSKSVLRVAADELVRNNPDMYYLPSYELVTECSRQPWQDDFRHVTPDTVQRVIQMFTEMFVQDAPT